MAETDIPENINPCLSAEQISAVKKALFVNWLLNYARAYPSNFPEKSGRIIHQRMGDPSMVVAALSKDEILAWHNHNRTTDPMTAPEFEAIVELQRQRGLVVIHGNYYALVV